MCVCMCILWLEIGVCIPGERPTSCPKSLATFFNASGGIRTSSVLSTASTSGKALYLLATRAGIVDYLSPNVCIIDRQKPFEHAVPQLQPFQQPPASLIITYIWLVLDHQLPAWMRNALRFPNAFLSKWSLP